MTRPSDSITGSSSDDGRDDASGVGNRRALADFLKSRRERVVPTDVGLSGGSRRRTGGLRREEVAFLAGISVTWYVYLEQAREVQPSRELIDSLAQALRLSEDERRYMHTLAHGAAAGAAPLAVDLSPADVVGQIVGQSADSPYPVYAGNHYGDLIAWNPAAHDWYGNWDRLGVGHNYLRWLISDPVAHDRLVDWEGEARDMVARWRSESARHPVDERTTTLRAELAQLHPDFADWWQHHEVQEHRSRLRHFRHPRLGLQAFRLVPLITPEFPSVAVVLHLPVPSVVSDGVAG